MSSQASDVGDGAAWLTGWRLAAYYGLLAALVVVPVLSVTVPLLGDYPNHLARVHILESLGTDSKLAALYDRPARIVPYQAMDVVVAALHAVMPLYAAGRVFVALCLLVPPAAAASLRYMLQRRVGLAPAAGFLLSYNYLLSRGLLDYLFSAGLCVALFAVWLSTASWPRWRRASLCGLGLTVVFLGHAYAGVTYCVLVAGEQIEMAVRRRFQPVWDIAQDWIAAAAQVLPCLVLAFGFGASGAFGAGAQTHYGKLANKIAAAFTPVFFPGPEWMFAVFGLLPLAVLVLLATRRLRLAPVLVGPVLAVTLAAAAAPNVLFNAWATDMRLPIVLYIVLLGGLMVARPLRPRFVTVAAVALVFLVAARAATALVLLQKLDMQAAQVRGLVVGLPPGARLLVVDSGPDVGPLRVTQGVLTEHMALLATVDRDAFVPFLLTGATPVVPKPALAASSSPNARPIDINQLRDGATRSDPAGPLPPYGFGGNVYWLGWPKKFDYVMVMTFGADLGPMPSSLRRVASVPIATLYRVVRS